MRVISGKYKRCELKGFNVEGIRPTMDKVKEAIFAMIYEYVDDSICLDLFAGTGSLGIEALSNGSKHVYFIDVSKDSIDTIKYNVNKVKCEIDATIICSNYLSILKRFKEDNMKFDIIFIDPPYGKIKIKKVLDDIIEYDILKDNGIVICEYEDEELEENYSSLSLIKYRKYGRTFISIYKNMR